MSEEFVADGKKKKEKKKGKNKLRGEKKGEKAGDWSWSETVKERT